MSHSSACSTDLDSSGEKSDSTPQAQRLTRLAEGDTDSVGTSGGSLKFKRQESPSNFDALKFKRQVSPSTFDALTPSQVTCIVGGGAEQTAFAQKGAQALIQIANEGVAGLAKLNDERTAPVADNSSTTEMDDDFFEQDGFVRQLSFQNGGFVRQTSLALSDCFVRQVSAESVQAFADFVQQDFQASTEEARDQSLSKEHPPLEASRVQDIDMCANLVQRSVQACAQLMKDGVRACERLEAKAMQSQQEILSAAFDATLTVNAAQDGVIVDCNASAERLFCMPVKGKSLGDIIIDESQADLNRLIVSGTDSEAPGRVLVTAEDSNGMLFDCELRVVDPLSDRSSDWFFLGLNLVGEKREPPDTTSEHGTSNETEFTLALTQTDGGTDVGVGCECSTQTSATCIDNSTIAVQTEVHVDANRAGYVGLGRRLTHPPLLPDVEPPSDVKAGSRPSLHRRGSSPRARSFRHSPSAETPASHLAPKSPESSMMRSQSQPPSAAHSSSSSSTGVPRDMGSMSGEWVAVSANGLHGQNSISDLSHWLRSLTILGDAVVLGDGTMTKLERRRDGFFRLHGGLLILDGDFLHRDGKSGNRVSFRRASDCRSETSEDDAASFVGSFVDEQRNPTNEQPNPAHEQPNQESRRNVRDAGC